MFPWRAPSRPSAPRASYTARMKTAAVRHVLRVMSILCVAGVAASPLMLAGCKRAPEAEANKIRQDRYTVRGEITQLPTPGAPLVEFSVRHEAMPHFRGQGGELGMDTMNMPFPLKEGVSLEGFAVGDKVELAFEVDFDAATDALLGYRATGLTKLPAETVLDFTPLPKPAPAE